MLKLIKSIISDLPDKIENTQYCNLSKEQASLYKSITADLLKEVEEAEGINRRGIILKTAYHTETGMQPSGAIFKKQGRPEAGAIGQDAFITAIIRNHL